MQPYKSEFIQLALNAQALKFGDFTLKSGRKSPYFFNIGVFNNGQLLASLSQFYALTMLQSDINFDVLFGPAYKGIPLACSTAMTLATRFNCSTPFCFNRKEVKDHGEGGRMVGAPLQGKVLVIDDVITAGTAINEAATFIKAANAELAGIIIALDREEPGTDTLQSAVLQVSEYYQIPVISIISLTDIIHYLKQENFDAALIQTLEAHRC